MEPTHFPTRHPTSNPSHDPTTEPTIDPTADPTAVPTFSPSLSPTRFPPVLSDYDAYILLDYSLNGLSTANKMTLWGNVDTVVPEMTEMLERGYNQRSSGQLEYQSFGLIIDSINEIEISSLITTDANSDTSKELYDALDVNNLWMTAVTLSVTIDIEQGLAALVTGNTDDEFAAKMNENFQGYFNNSGLSFEIETSPDALVAVVVDSDSDDTETNWVWNAAIIILATGALTSGAAFLWNKLPTNSDESEWIAPFMLSLNVYDVVSDIFLLYSIAMEASDDDFSFDSSHTWLAAASFTTIAIPFVLNAVYATTIQRQPAVKENPDARVWYVTCCLLPRLLLLFC